jgi:hypothetical protein
MPYPDKPNIQTSYTAYEQSLGDGSLPGQELDNDFANLADSVESLNDFVRGVTRSDGALKNGIVTRDSLSTAVLVDLGAAEPTGAVYATRAEFVAANTLNPGLTRADGYVLLANGLEYRRLAASTAIPDLPGWVPNGRATPQHFGAVGNNVADDRPAFAALNTFGGDVYLPKPAVGYNVSSPINLNRPGITVDPTASWEALTDSGNITWNTNLFTQQDPPVPVHRFNGRVFMGDAAHEMAGGWVAGGGTTDDRGTAAWYAKDTPIFGGYTARDATAVIANGKGTIALALSARSSQQWNASWQAPIGLAVMMYNDGNAAGADSSAWGIIVEGRQTRAGRRTFAMEVALGNLSGVAVRPTPYNVSANPTNGGVIGIWMAGGGDASVSSPATAPNAAAMVVLKGISNTGLASGWESGIVFGPDALTGTDGTAGSGTFADAVSMCRNQTIAWHEPSTDAKAFSITSRYTTATDATRLEGYASGGIMGLRLSRQSTGQTLLDLRNVSTNTGTTAVLQAETAAVRLTGEGSASDIDVFLVPKGSGNVRFGTRTASSDVPVTGYIEIKDAAGTVRRLAVVG